MSKRIREQVVGLFPKVMDAHHWAKIIVKTWGGTYNIWQFDDGRCIVYLTGTERLPKAENLTIIILKKNECGFELF